MNLFEIIKILIEVILIGAFAYYVWYFQQKGKNQANKEDVQKLTELVEETKIQYSRQLEAILQQNRLLIEEYKSKNQLKLAALDKRLEVHQQAFALWKEIIHNVHDREKIHEVTIKCQKWWNENCLYLNDESRSAFWSCIMAASLHKELLTAPREDAKIINENWAEIKNVGKILIESVQLPPISGSDFNVGNLENHEDDQN